MAREPSHDPRMGPTEAPYTDQDLPPLALSPRRVCPVLGFQRERQDESSILSKEQMAAMEPYNSNRICPTLQEAGMWRIDTPIAADHPAFEHDYAWFAEQAFANRRLLIRTIIGSEFGGSSFNTPMWVCVDQLATGFHRVVPVWRGEAFFRCIGSLPTSCMVALREASVLVPDISSGGEAAVLLDECSRRGGVDDGTTRQV
jgi:hypothetical protein